MSDEKPTKKPVVSHGELPMSSIRHDGVDPNAPLRVDEMMRAIELLTGEPASIHNLWVWHDGQMRRASEVAELLDKPKNDP